MNEPAKTLRYGYRGYVNHQPFVGHCIPAGQQNTILSSYAGRNGLTFLLSIQELNFVGSYIMLNELLHQANELEGIIMTSLFQLPEDTDMRNSAVKSCLQAGCEIHFVFENLILRNVEEVSRMDTIRNVVNIIGHCPRLIPQELQPDFLPYASFTDTNA